MKRCAVVAGACLLWISLAIPVVTTASAATNSWQWTRQIGTSSLDTGRAVARDGHGNVYLVGQANFTLPGSINLSAGGADAFIAKYDRYGRTVWVRQLGSPDHEMATGVATDATGAVFVVGWTTGRIATAPESNAGGTDAFVARVQSDGQLSWVHQFGSSNDDEARGVAVDSNGAVRVVGIARGALVGSPDAFGGASDAFLAKYLGDGSRQWIRLLGETTLEAANAVSSDGSGNSYLAGYTTGGLPGSPDISAGEGEMFIAKYGPDGSRLWVRELGSPAFDAANAVATGPDGSAYVAGETSGTLPGSPTASAGHYDAFLARYDPDGQLTWVRQLGSGSNDFARAVTVGPRGVSIAGLTYGQLPGAAGTNGAADAFFADYGPDGSVAFVVRIGTSGEDYAYGIVADEVGGLLLGGETRGRLTGSPDANAGNNDAFVARYAPNDTSPPSISPTETGTVGASGWYTSDVTVSWQIHDSESLPTPEQCPSVTLSHDTTGSELSCTATSAGGTATSYLTVKRDATPPTVLLEGVADGVTYPVGSKPHPVCRTSDGTSGVATDAELLVNGGSPRGTGEFTAVCAGASDVAGNAAQPQSVRYYLAKSVSIADASVVEGDTGTQRVLRFSVVLSEPSPTKVVIPYVVEAIGSASAPSEFRAASGTLTFRPSATTGLTPTAKFVGVAVYPDGVPEDTEAFRVRLLSGDSYRLAAPTAIGRILDDDPPGLDPEVSLGDASIVEGNLATSSTVGNPVRLTLTLRAPAISTMSVLCSIVPGTAQAGTDYRTARPLRVTFKPGQWQKSVAVNVLADLAAEDDETVFVVLSDPLGGLRIGRGSGSVTILNED